MKRIIAAIPLAPLSYMLFRFLDLCGRGWTERLKAADPQFPQTCVQMLQKAGIERFTWLIPLVIMVLAIELLISRVFGYLVERERIHYEAETKK